MWRLIGMALALTLLGCGHGYVGMNSLRCGNADSRCFSLSDGWALFARDAQVEVTRDESGVLVLQSATGNFDLVVGEGTVLDAEGSGTQQTILGLAGTLSKLALAQGETSGETAGGSDEEFFDPSTVANRE